MFLISKILLSIHPCRCFIEESSHIKLTSAQKMPISADITTLAQIKSTSAHVRPISVQFKSNSAQNIPISAQLAFQVNFDSKQASPSSQSLLNSPLQFKSSQDMPIRHAYFSPNINSNQQAHSCSISQDMPISALTSTSP